MHLMRRDAAAIALYLYLVAALTPQLFRLLPLPPVLQSHSNFFVIVTTGALWVGCLIAALGRFWRDELDGGAIEQVGLIAAILGWLLYIWALVQILPTSWFGTTLCGGFLIAFGWQWWLIRRWRRSLRALAEGKR